MKIVVTHNKIIIIYWPEVKQSDAITHQIKYVCCLFGCLFRFEQHLLDGSDSFARVLEVLSPPVGRLGLLLDNYKMDEDRIICVSKAKPRDVIISPRQSQAQLDTSISKNNTYLCFQM